MNRNEIEMKEPSIRLLPHQAAFVEAVLNPAGKRVTLLQGDVGLGKGAALVALAGRFLQEQATAKVLFLVPGIAQRDQLVERLQRSGTPALSVDRYRFRELLETTTGKDIWPAGVVAVLGREFARQEDIREALASGQWDLLIVNEAHQFKVGLAGEVLRQVGTATKRMVLATIPNVELADVFPEEDAIVIQWKRDQIVDYSGKPLDTVPLPVLHAIHFNLSPAELNLAEIVGELCRILETDEFPQSWRAKLLVHSLDSSPAVLENALAQIREGRNRIVQGMDLSQDSSEQEPLEDQAGGDLDSDMAKKAAELAAYALERMEEVSCDSKLAAFMDFLRGINTVKEPNRRICVLTDYVSTLFYLATEMENIETVCHVFYGGMNAERRQRTLAEYSINGGVLTATRATMSDGVTLSEVTDLFLYDVPSTPVALQQVLGRFDRLGRRNQLNVYSLLPHETPVSAKSGPFELLHKILGAPDPNASV